MSDPSSSNGLRAVSGLIVLLALAAWSYREVPGLAYTGVDASSWVHDSSFSGPGGVASVFWSRHFVSYRPLTAGTYALGRVLHGIEAWGYQVTDFLLHLGCVIATFGLARRLLRGPLVATVAAGVVALHPIGMEVVPVLARRGDLLVTLLATLAMWAAIDRRLIGCSLLAAAALLSKEPAVVVPGLVFLLGIARGATAAAARGASTAGPDSVRTIPALLRGGRDAAGPLTAIAAVIGLRLLVLGEIGGYTRETITPWATVGDYMLGLSMPGIGALFPSVALHGAPVPGMMRLAMLLASLAVPFTALALLRRRLFRPSRHDVTCLILGPVWLLALLALYLVSGTFHLRLLYPSLVPLGLTLGWGVRRALDRPTAIARVGLAALGLLVLSWIVLGPVVRGVGEWREASRLQARLLQAVEAACPRDGSPPRILVVNYPFGVRYDAANRRPSFSRASVFHELDYTEPTGETGIQNLLALRHPDPRVQALTYVTLRAPDPAIEVAIQEQGSTLLLRLQHGPFAFYGNPKLGLFGPPDQPISYDRPVPAGFKLLIFDLRKGKTFPFPSSVRIEPTPRERDS